MDIFEKRLKDLRAEKGKTQKELALELGTTDDSVYSWEKGRSQPSIEIIRKLCTYFDISADYLLGLEDETGGKIYGAKYNIGTINNSGEINIK